MIQARKFLLPVAALCLLLLVIAWMAGLFNDRIAPGVESGDGQSVEDVLVVSSSMEPITEAVPASVQAVEHTVVSSRLLARVSRLLVRSGDTVEAGALLVALEDDDLTAQTRQARESVNSIQAQLDEASRNLQRATSMHERGLIADTDLDAAISSARTLEADLQRARRRVEESEAIPCEIWREIERDFDEGGLGLSLSRNYGFDGSEWIDGALGFSREIRSAVHARMQECGLAP